MLTARGDWCVVAFRDIHSRLLDIRRAAIVVQRQHGGTTIDCAIGVETERLCDGIFNRSAKGEYVYAVFIRFGLIRHDAVSGVHLDLESSLDCFPRITDGEYVRHKRNTRATREQRELSLPERPIFVRVKVDYVSGRVARHRQLRRVRHRNRF